MADNRFNIAKTLGILGPKLEISSFTKGQDQLTVEGVEDTRIIAHVRTHLERIIGSLRKKYSILNWTLPTDYSL